MVDRVLALLASLCAFALLSAPAQAALTIDITQAVKDGRPVAVVPFGGNGGGQTDIGAVIRADLNRSGLFRIMDPRTFPAQPHTPGEVNLGTWKSIGTDALVIGLVQPAGGQLSVEFRLYTPGNGQELAAQRFTVPESELRALAHRIADIIYEKLTGEPGAFFSRLAYITQSGKIYRLNVSDSDGANPQVVVSSRAPLMSPAWSPDGRKLAYVSFEAGRSAVYIQDLGTGKRERVAFYPGINSAPAFSPDGRSLALSLSRDGNAELYVLDLSGRELRRLTNNPAIDTEPTWSPDGRSIVFTSDRSGSPQLYRVAAGGGEPRRLTFSGSYNAAATYAPRGGTIAFVHRSGGVYTLARINEDGSGLRVLDQTANNESPSFAPNGRMALYATRRGGRQVLAAVSVDGRVKQVIQVPREDIREPAWSPR
ncbi:MAG: Tol-Pal system beta propeller repeat protein TolB [Pseudomonadota bacterium]